MSEGLKKLGLGGATLGSISGVPLEEAEELIAHGLELGIRFFDTANIYGQGDSERSMAQVLNLGGIVGTKGGYSMPTAMSGSSARGKVRGSRLKQFARYVIQRFPGLKGPLMRVRGNVTQSQDFSFEALSGSAKQSAERLGVNQLPLFMLHSPSKEVLRDTDALSNLLRLKEDSIIEKAGIAVASASELVGQKLPEGLDYVQVELNLLSPLSDFDVLETIKNETGVTVVARRPYGGGILLSGGDTQADPVVERLRAYASDSGLEPKEVALLALLGCPFIDYVLVGTTQKRHLEDNVHIAKSDRALATYQSIMEILKEIQR